MRKSKNLRSRCRNEFCRKQFRHADPAAEYCSAACRQAVYRIRLKANKKLVLSEKYARIAAAFVQGQEAGRQGTELERSAPEPVEEPSRPSEPAEAAPYYPHVITPTRVGGRMDDTPRTITLTMKAPYQPTPLNRRRR